MQYAEIHNTQNIKEIGERLDKILCGSLRKYSVQSHFGWDVVHRKQHPADYVDSRLGNGSYDILFSHLVKNFLASLEERNEAAIQPANLGKMLAEFEAETGECQKIIKKGDKFRCALSRELILLRKEHLNKRILREFLKVHLNGNAVNGNYEPLLLG